MSFNNNDVDSLTIFEENPVIEIEVNENEVNENEVNENDVNENIGIQNEVNENKVNENKVNEYKVEESKVEKSKVEENKVNENKVDENKNKTKVYYNVSKNNQQSAVAQEQNLNQIQNQDQSENQIQNENQLYSNLNTNNNSTNFLNNNSNNKLTDNPNNIILPHKESHSSINLFQHILIGGCVALFVLVLFCVTKKYYFNKKDIDNKKADSDSNSSKYSRKFGSSPFKNRFGNKNKFGKKSGESREQIPSILMVSPAPLASLSDENAKFRESSLVDKDINVHESIIQAQSYERNSSNFTDIRTLSWRPRNDYQYNINDISHCSSTDVTTDRGSTISETNKLDNVVDVYFSNKRIDIIRQNSSSSCYSNIPDNASSCGEPSLSRYIDNDALLKYESTKSKLSMCKDDNHTPNIGNIRNASLKPQTFGNRASLSRFSVKNISSSIAFRNNNDFNSNQKYNKLRNSKVQASSGLSHQLYHAQSKSSLASSNDDNSTNTSVSENKTLSTEEQLNNVSNANKTLSETTSKNDITEDNDSNTIDINTPEDSSTKISVHVPKLSHKDSTQNDFPTIIVNSQNTPCTPVESVYYRF